MANTDRPAPPSRDDVLGVLGTVIDPELGDDIVSLGMVPDVVVGHDGKVIVGIKLTIGGCPLRADIKREVEGRVGLHPGVTEVAIEWGEMNADERAEVMGKARWKARELAPDTEIPSRCQVLAIGSGKGGVGKSSVTVNLATALAAQGHTVGVLDADIWGFSVPRLLGMSDRMEAERVDGSDKPKIIPNRKAVGDGLLEVVSTGFLVEESTALMWRGLMLAKAVEQFLADVAWGDLDYLLIDMPPGTGDVQMGLARMLPRTSMVIVTTPAIAAQKVAQRCRRHGEAQFPAGRRGGREHECVHLRPRTHLRAVRRRRWRRARRRHRRTAPGTCAARAGGGRRQRRGSAGIAHRRGSRGAGLPLDGCPHQQRDRPAGSADRRRHDGMLGTTARRRQRRVRRATRTELNDLAQRPVSTNSGSGVMS